jgi:hypothetical protein
LRRRDLTAKKRRQREGGCFLTPFQGWRRYNPAFPGRCPGLACGASSRLISERLSSRAGPGDATTASTSQLASAKSYSKMT